MTYSSRRNVDAAFARLLSHSYGPPPVAPRRAPGRAVTLSADAGTEVVGTAAPVVEEYVVERGEPPVGAGGGVAGAAAGAAPTPDAAASPVPSASSPPSSPAPSAPSASNPAPSAPAATAPAPPPPALPPADALPPSPSAPPSAPPPAADIAPPPAPAPQPAPAPLPGPDPYAAATLPGADPGAADPAASLAPAAPVTGDDLAADMQAILLGQKVYDPANGGMRDRAPSPPPPEPPVAAKNEQAIFDRIAESMAYANAFDLGTVELKRRFDTFDRVGARPAPPAAPAPVAPGQREFIQDLSVIDATRTAATPLAVPFWSALPITTERRATVHLGEIGRLSPADFSRPFFDTGEHVRSGDEVGVVPLTIGGVSFSYGDIVAMPDFFENPEDLTGASAAELGALRGLIRRSAEFYRSAAGSNPSDADWSAATGGRYLQLAAENYTHFSPPDVVQESFAQSRGDNRARYAQLHRQALAESQRLHLAHPQATPTLETALIVNAFADHFLTDAFASGHLVNKELIISRYRGAFLGGSGLTPAGEAFFDRVAQRAFRGEVARRFSELEQATPTVDVGPIEWHANINSASRFATLLKRAATQEPDKVANVAVKALHDHLNRAGVLVGNGAGAAPWQLHGDGNLDATTLAVMRQAVGQSVANLSDPSLLASGVDLQSFVDRVWAFVPVPTAAGLATLRAALQTYTDPASTVLSDAAADLITSQLSQLIDELISGGHLRRA